MPILMRVTADEFGVAEDGGAGAVLQLAHARLGSDEFLHRV